MENFNYIFLLHNEIKFTRFIAELKAVTIPYFDYYYIYAIFSLVKLMIKHEKETPYEKLSRLHSTAEFPGQATIRQI